MAKEDNIKFDSDEGLFYGETERDKKQWKEQYPYLDDFDEQKKKAAQHLATRNSYIKDEARKNPRDFLEWYFRRENFLLIPTPSGKQVKLKQLEIQTPTELYDFIEQLFATGLTELNKKLSRPNSEPFAKEGYNIALGYATRLRKSNPKLPPLPQPKSDPITALRYLQEWTIQSAGTERNATPTKRRGIWMWIKGLAIELYGLTIERITKAYLDKYG